MPFLTAGKEPHPIDIPVRLTARGAEIHVPSTLDFGEVESAPSTVVSVVNGNWPVDISIGIPTDHSFISTWVSMATVSPNEPLNLAYAFAPKRPGLVSELLPIVVKGPVCGPIPAALELRGRGFLGDAKLNLTSLDFGFIDCDTRAPPKSIVLQNAGAAPFSFGTSFAVGTTYTVDPPTGAVAPGSSLILSIIPTTVTPPVEVGTDFLGDTLTISTTVKERRPMTWPFMGRREVEFSLRSRTTIFYVRTSLR